MFGVDIKRGVAMFIALAVQVLVGTLIFAIMLLAAVGLYQLVHYLQAHHAIPSWIAAWASIVEVAIVVFDTLMFALFLAGEGIKFYRVCRKEWNSHD